MWQSGGDTKDGWCCVRTLIILDIRSGKGWAHDASVEEVDGSELANGPWERPEQP